MNDRVRLSEFIETQYEEKHWVSLHPPTNDGRSLVYPYTRLQAALGEVQRQRVIDRSTRAHGKYAYRVRHKLTGQTIVC